MHAQGAFDRIEFEGMSFDERYRMLNGSVIPRPIAFVTTLNQDGSINAAPFSSFMIASVEAGLLAFSVGPNPVPKKTLRNIRRLGEFVINTVPEELAHQVQVCGDAQEREATKLEAARLNTLESERIGTPRIAESKIQFECMLHKILNFGESHMVVGEVVLMHARSGLVREGKIDPLLYAPLGRIAGRNYCRVRELISV
jgi:flavin reductase (DIM6/NTAB) family NADH-FMN oxidoreductase RutF